ncbi:MAG TPA: hypothetical protein VHG93_07795 [Longimicrobium sp.]|nr:hypothetical protein [Longimicrobium sp.]
MHTRSILQMMVLSALVLGCEFGNRAPTDERATSPSDFPDDALDQAVLAFVGNPARTEIKSRMDVALRLYGLQPTEENYSRAGSVLVTLRKQNGTPEMAILDYMIRSHVDGVNLSFPEGAAIASVFLATGDG